MKVRRIVALLLGLFFAADALWMLVAPFHWYAYVPGVTETGPANAHLIRDVGCAFLVTALALLWFAVAPMRAWPAVLAGGAIPLLARFRSCVGHHCGPRAPSSPSDRNPYGHLTGITHPLARVAAKSYFQRGVRIARLKRRPNKKNAAPKSRACILPEFAVLLICCCTFDLSSIQLFLPSASQISRGPRP
jgi:hypothetical protein